MITRHKPDFALLPEADIIAISSHVNDYRLCWALNLGMGINLARREKDIETEGTGKTAAFPAFDHINEDLGMETVTVVGNRTEGAVLLTEQWNADYFLVLLEVGGWHVREVLESVRRTEFVLAAYTLDPRKIKGIHKLFE